LILQVRQFFVKFEEKNHLPADLLKLKQKTEDIQIKVDLIRNKVEASFALTDDLSLSKFLFNKLKT